jgi:hypothetical protein
VSGNPSGRSRAAADVIEAAREHTAAALGRLVQLMEQDEDRSIALSAAAELLNRGWGKPPVFAEVNNVGDQVIRYDIRWADAGTNSFPEDKPATIDATATDAEEAEGDGPIVVWGDGTRAG